MKQISLYWITLLLMFICVLFLTSCSTNNNESNDFLINIYDQDKAQDGTTLFFTDIDGSLCIVEVDMEGNIIWRYDLEGEIKEHTSPGFDIEILDNNNLQLLAPKLGVFEITRNGEIVRSYYDEKVSHDADRLDNGNVLIAYGASDTKEDAQAKEIDHEGNVVWEWYAAEHFDYDISCSGFTHTNAVERLKNGNTLISLRNFNFLVIVDEEGEIVRKVGEGILYSPHDPEVLGNTITVASQGTLDCYLNQMDDYTAAMEMNLYNDEILWQYDEGEWSDSLCGQKKPCDNQLVRDVNKLSNGNYLIVGTAKIIEVTTNGEIVWELETNNEINNDSKARLGFYKAIRIES